MKRNNKLYLAMKKFLTLAICLFASSALFAQTTQIIAHRGFHATKNSVRNSLSALQNAQDFGAYGSECDINETADGVLVVVHGPMHGKYNVHAWKIPWTEEPDRLQSKGLQRGKHN